MPPAQVVPSVQVARLDAVTVAGRDTSQRLVDCAAVRGFVRRVCFKTGSPELVGTELEWLVASAADSAETTSCHHMAR